MASPTTLRVQATHRSRKVAEPIGGPETDQGAVPLCSRTPVLSEGGEEIDDVGITSQ